MSDTYDSLDAYYAKTQREGGATGIKHSDDADHPQQDFGKFSDQIDRRLKENSPEEAGNDVFRESDDNGKCGG